MYLAEFLNLNSERIKVKAFGMGLYFSHPKNILQLLKNNLNVWSC